jgi:hypothetical protein
MELGSIFMAGFYAAPYPADQAYRYVEDAARFDPKPCAECDELTARTWNDVPTCRDCLPCCSDEDGPCDKHNPYSGCRSW